ncbi:MAG: hypothetical protein U0270_32050 [Labilithrix sp.]
MALHPFVDGIVLDVAYRGSLESQTLDIGVKTDGPPELPLAQWAVESLVSSVNRGLAGGAEFAPAEGQAALEKSDAQAFRLVVRGVSPRFVRVIVEQLAATAHPHRVTAISIVGSLPTDVTPLSVREPQVSAWLDDADAYPRAFPAPPFRVTTKHVPRGATLKVTVAGGRLEEVAAPLEETFSAWQTAILTYPTLAKKGRGVAAPHATFARTRTELFAKLALFDHVREPARDQLINALARFHATVAPLAAVEIATP